MADDGYIGDLRVKIDKLLFLFEVVLVICHILSEKVMTKNFEI